MSFSLCRLYELTRVFRVSVGGSSSFSALTFTAKALTWQNHSSLGPARPRPARLGSAPHCFTSDVSPSPYKPTDKIFCLTFYCRLFYTYHFARPQCSLFKRRDLSEVNVFILFFTYVLIYFFCGSGFFFWALKCLLFVFCCTAAESA